jgi:SAM-dependent methyltransferase
MSFAARLLRLLSIDPRAIDEGLAKRLTPADARAEMSSLWPAIMGQLGGTKVLDFGCGHGAHAVALAELGCDVTGLDIQSRLLRDARELAGNLNVRFIEALQPEESFDWIVSINSMEHFRDPLAVLQDMKRHLRPGGGVLVTFCPTWLSPYGAHMHYFTRVPWVHLLFPESAVMEVRSRYQRDGAKRYEDVEGGLNKMTVGRFKQLCADVGLTFTFLRVDYVKGMQWAGRLPTLRELLANRVTALLRRASSEAA